MGLCADPSRVLLPGSFLRRGAQTASQTGEGAEEESTLFLAGWRPASTIDVHGDAHRLERALTATPTGRLLSVLGWRLVIQEQPLPKMTGWGGVGAP